MDQKLQYNILRCFEYYNQAPSTADTYSIPEAVAAMAASMFSELVDSLNVRVLRKVSASFLLRKALVTGSSFPTATTA